MKNKNKIYGFMISILLLSISCTKKGDGIMSQGIATIEVKIAESAFEGVDNVNLASLTRKTKPEEDQRVFVPLSDEYSISVVLSEVNNGNQIVKANSIVKKAVVERSTLANGIRYKLAIYRSTGQYVTERNYVRGQESSTAALLLDGGVTYTFVAYSVSSTTLLPDIVFSDNNNRTLATSSLQNVGSDSYLLYYRANVTPASNQTTNLAIILTHKFSQINATVDASLTGLNITSLTARINAHFLSTNMTLSGVVTRSNGGWVDVVFPNQGTQSITSSSLLINTVLTNASFVMSNITVGTISRTNISVPNLTIASGKKYNLIVKVIPKDSIFTDPNSGIPVARIGSVVWMRHNVGVNTALDPGDATSNTSALVGNYYQWGSGTVVANGNTSAAAIANWNASIVNAANNWNWGTEAAPVRNLTNDPCPLGFRVPTSTEFSNLIASTTQQNRSQGSFGGNDVNNFRPMRIFKSLLNDNVILAFPIAGYRSTYNGELLGRGTSGAYWASTNSTNPQAISNLFLQSTTTVGLGTVDSKSFGNNIRCVRILN